MAFRSNLTVKPLQDGFAVIEKKTGYVVRKHFWCSKAAWDYIRFLEAGKLGTVDQW